ncbi:MAG: hypothetical protein ABIK33_03235 [candidate division WOR-3 bacterium]
MIQENNKNELEVLGYSERGVVNSLIYEILYSNNSIDILQKFIRQIKLVDGSTLNFNVQNAKIFIEQTLSQFGDPDLFLLIDDKLTDENVKKYIIFFEAKACQHKNWQISKQFEEFENGLTTHRKNYSSNLFIQLFFKTLFFKKLKNTEENQLQTIQVEEELRVLTNRLLIKNRYARKIGKNKTVIEAVRRMKYYADNALFIMVIPETECNMKQFFKDNKNKIETLLKCNIKNWGYITWEQIEKFCQENQLTKTMGVFSFNGQQIYKKSKNRS